MKTKQMCTVRYNTKCYKSIGEILRSLRKEKNLPLRRVASLLDIDQSYLSKIERGEKAASKEQITELSKIYGINKETLLIQYLSDKVVSELKKEILAMEVLRVAEKKLSYLNND